MLPILQIGPLAVQTPGLILLAGLWLGLTLAERFAGQRNLHPNYLYNLVFSALAAGLVGARLTYALRYPQAFLQNPASLLTLNPGLLDLWGGITAGLATALFYGQRKKLQLLPTLDALTPALAIFNLALGLANLASGRGFGAPADLPWAIVLWGARRHPSQIYESLAAGLVLGLLWPGWRYIRLLRPGVLFLTFLALSATARLFLETFRGDSLLVFGGLRSAQLFAWLILAAALWGLGRLCPFVQVPTCNLSIPSSSNEQKPELEQNDD